MFKCCAQGTAVPAFLGVENTLAPREEAVAKNNRPELRAPHPAAAAPTWTRRAVPRDQTPPPRTSASASHPRPRGCRFLLLVSAGGCPIAHPAPSRQAGVSTLVVTEEGATHPGAPPATS